MRVVYVLEDGAPAPRRIEVGLADGAFTEVTGGELREGEPLVTGFAPGTPGAAAQGGRGGPRGFRIL
jgi:hypothetical protein